MMTATEIYGAPAVAAGPGGRSGLRVVGGGERVPKPDAATAPATTASPSSLADDPAFWLVAMFGAAAGLAIWSA